MADLTVVRPVLTGTAPTYTPANAGGDRFRPGSASVVWLHVKNTGGSPIDVRITDPTSVAPSGMAFSAAYVATTVPATSGDRMIKISEPQRFTDGSGWINLTYSATPTGVSVMAMS